MTAQRESSPEPHNIGRASALHVRAVNPWTWQDKFGFVQANELTGAGRLLFVAGQTSVDGDGRPLHPGAMAAQISQAIMNLEKVLDAAGMALANVVRLTWYVTDVDLYLREVPEIGERLATAGCWPAATLIQVARLAQPELLIEVEATAAA
jgi:enamine deaminase RidA (YjgF/YER057c/UK114 family)